MSGGLSKVAKELDVDRIGTMHQAGSDAFVTAAVYFKLKHKLKKLWNMDADSKIEERLNGKLFGIGDSINDEIYIDQYRNVATKLSYVDETGHVNLKLLTDTRVPSNIPQSNSGQGHINNIIQGRSGSSQHGVLTQPSPVQQPVEMPKQQIPTMQMDMRHGQQQQWMPNQNPNMVNQHNFMGQNMMLNEAMMQMP